jgi:uncharacterized GH25 family protein
VIQAPDGSKVEPQNVATGKYRSTFDVQLSQPGTYKIAQVGANGFANWTENGVARNWRGNLADMSKEVPEKAENLQVSRMNNRVEIFVTAGKPTRSVLEPTGLGLELVPVTHPNDLVTGEDAKFQFLLNGKPAADLEVTVIPGGIRYRDALMEAKYKTDGEGKFTVKFATPGMYWMNAAVGAGGRGPGGPGGPVGPGAPSGPRAPGGPGGPGGPAGRMPAGDRSSYVAVLEVMAQ